MRIKTSELTEQGLMHVLSLPDLSWQTCGPILERENISVGYQGHSGVPLDSLWYATNRVDACGFGQKPLTAVLRCFVTSKLGDTVEVPDELL